MELLQSNYPPLNTGSRVFSDVFRELLNHARNVRIAVGYVSEDSLLYLFDLIKETQELKIDLTIGMHYFEGFTPSQLAATFDLERLLVGNDRGTVSLVTSLPYHGKLYWFGNQDESLASIIGSSNLARILPTQARRVYESDLLSTNPDFSTEILSFQKSLQDVSMPLASLQKQELKIIDEKSRLSKVHGVSEVPELELVGIRNDLDDSKTIEIELKAHEVAPKSNLNTFQGVGRFSNGLEIKRPWYEVELIVPKSIGTSENYPLAERGQKNRLFDVVTDDGFSFRCITSGDNGKNLRSAEDLTILGRWLKGRLNRAGSLTIGEPVRNANLEHYGRRSISLTPIGENKWFLSFGRNSE